LGGKIIKKLKFLFDFLSCYNTIDKDGMNMEPVKNKLPETGIRIYHLAGPLRHSALGIEVLFVLAGKVREAKLPNLLGLR
jgi:hypothetical protein